MESQPIITIENENKEKTESENEEELDPVKAAKIFLEILVELYGKKQYKKILQKFPDTQKEEPTIMSFNEWKILHLKILSLQKIIEHKISKYYKNPSASKTLQYIYKENKEIYNWLLISYQLDIDNKNYIDSFSEISIQFLLKKCVNFSKFCINNGKIKDAIGFLSLGVRLIMKTNEFFISPDSFYLSAEILLHLSSLLIAEGSFETAKNLIKILIKFNYLSIEMKLVNDNISFSFFNILKNSEDELNIITKILFNMSIAFYQLGICYENEGDNYNSFYAYKTSDWFNKILSYDNNKILFSEYIEDVHVRQLMRNRIIIFFERCVSKKELQDEVHERKKVYSRLFMEEEKKKQKFEKIEKMINTLKLVDVDDEEPNLFDKVGCKPVKENIIKSMKHVHLLNYLLGDNFKEMIFNTKTIEINKLNKDTIDNIQKIIINIKNNERHKLEKRFKNMEKDKKKKRDKKYIVKSPLTLKNNNTNKVKSYFNSNYDIFSSSHKKKRPQSEYHTSKSTKNKLYTENTQKNKINITESFYSMNTRPNTAKGYNKSYNNYGRDKIMNTQRNYNLRNNRVQSAKIKSNIIYNTENFFNENKKSLRMEKRNKTIVHKHSHQYIPKYEFNKYYFNKGFKKKENFLEKQFDRELDFQKRLLKTKCNKEEIYEKIEGVNITEINKKCDEFFYSTLTNELMNINERKIFFDKASLNKKSMKAKKKTPKKSHILQINIKKDENCYKEKNEINAINEDCINDIMNDMMKISCDEKRLIKNMKRTFK